MAFPECPVHLMDFREVRDCLRKRFLLRYEQSLETAVIMEASTLGCSSTIEMLRVEMSSFSRAERRQVERHKYFLSQKRGMDVGFEMAAEDWLDKHSQEWREERHRRMLAMQRDEIAKYKWLRSEEARRDLGSAAALEWIRLYAAAWREWFDKEYEDVDELPGSRR